MIIQSATFQAVPQYLPDAVEHRRQLAQAINNTIKGKINVSFPVVLTPSATTTLIQDSRISAFSVISPAMATTAHGAAAVAAGIWVTDLMPQLANKPGSAVIHHASSANTDQNITFTIIG